MHACTACSPTQQAPCPRQLAACVGAALHPDPSNNQCMHGPKGRKQFPTAGSPCASPPGCCSLGGWPGAGRAAGRTPRTTGSGQARRLPPPWSAGPRRTPASARLLGRSVRRSTGKGSEERERGGDSGGCWPSMVGHPRLPRRHCWLQQQASLPRHDTPPCKPACCRRTVVVAHQLVYHCAQVLPQVVCRQQPRKHGYRGGGRLLDLRKHGCGGRLRGSEGAEHAGQVHANGLGSWGLSTRAGTPPHTRALRLRSLSGPPPLTARSVSCSSRCASTSSSNASSLPPASPAWGSLDARMGPGGREGGARVQRLGGMDKGAWRGGSVLVA